MPVSPTIALAAGLSAPCCRCWWPDGRDLSCAVIATAAGGRIENRRVRCGAGTGRTGPALRKGMPARGKIRTGRGRPG